jgi:aminopeptidase N
MALFFVRGSRIKAFNQALFTIILLFTAIGMQLNAQVKKVTYFADPASIPADLPVTIRHLTANVHFLPGENRVIATAHFTFIPNRYQTDSILFHTPDFKVSVVKINSRAVRYRQYGSKLVIFPEGNMIRPKKYTAGRAAADNVVPRDTISIGYTATPQAGAIYFIGWRPEEAGKRKQIWAHRPHGWLPYIEGRITMDLFVTFDSSYKVFSNGERMSKTGNADGTITWHYAMKKDHPFFSTALVIGDYDFKTSQTSRGLPLEFWYYADMPNRVASTYAYTEQMFDFFEKDMGVPYPYPVYRQAPVIDYMYGAMETTTSTVFGDYMQIDPRAWWQRNYVNVNAHELAHQWFGNYAGHFVNRDVWLTESFGTYYAKMFERSIFGDDYYQNLRNDELLLTLDAAGKNSFPVGGTQGGVQRIYQKGSLVLDMLRDVLGDREFRDAIRYYLEKYGFDYAETNDFIRCVYEATGKPYNWFFDQWILRGGEPEYRISDSVIADDHGNSAILFKISQIQEINEMNGLFKMPVTFEVCYKDGSCDSKTVLIENKYTEVLVPNPGKKQVDFLLFDPNRKILKKTIYDRSFDRLAAQAVRAKNMIDRYDAWLALRTVPLDSKFDILAAAFSKETFWLIKSEILSQLTSDYSPEAMEIFRQGLIDRDANVRKAALKNLQPVPDLLQSKVEEMLFDSSYLNVELALGALCVSFPGYIDYYLELTQDMEGWRGLNIRMKWLEMATRQGKTRFLPELVSYTGPKFEFETRMNAFTLLKKLNYTDEETRTYAEQASKHWNNKLSSAARDYLAK